MTLNISDYKQAPSGDGPLAGEWKDKPHRLLYDLCREVERLRKELEESREAECVGPAGNCAGYPGY